MITTLPALCTRTLVSVRPRLYCVTVAVWRVVAPAPSGEAPLAEGDKTGPTQPGQQYIGARGSPNSPIVLYFVSVLYLFCYISKFFSLHKKKLFASFQFRFYFQILKIFLKRENIWIYVNDEIAINEQYIYQESKEQQTV